MRKSSIICALLVAIVLQTAAFCETWQQVIDLAKSNNNQFRSAQKQYDSYQWSYYRAYSSFLPQISLSAGVSKSGYQTPLSLPKNYSYGVSISQSIFSGLSNLFDLQASYNNYQNSKASLDSTMASMLYDTRVAYINLAVAQENVKLQEEIAARRKENYRVIDLNYESGKEDKGNLMVSKANLDDALASISTAKRSLYLTKLKLSQLVLKDINSIATTPEVAQISGQDSKSLTEHSPAYLMAKYQLEAADIAFRSTLSEFLPNVTLSGNYSKSGTSWPPGTDGNSISLNMSYPIFPGGGNIADRAVYSLKLDSARFDFEKAKKDVLYSIEETYNNFKSSVDTLSARRELAEASSLRANIARVKYMNGLMSYNDWDTIENNNITAQKNLISARQSALAAEANYYKSYGGYIK